MNNPTTLHRKRNSAWSFGVPFSSARTQLCTQAMNTATNSWPLMFLHPVYPNVVQIGKLNEFKWNNYIRIFLLYWQRMPLTLISKCYPIFICSPEISKSFKNVWYLCQILPEMRKGDGSGLSVFVGRENGSRMKRTYGFGYRRKLVNTSKKGICWGSLLNQYLFNIYCVLLA